jgi:RNA polymerase sigma factor (sigma-70 family)
MTVASPHTLVFGEAIRPCLDIAYRVAEQLTDSPRQAEDCLVEAAVVGSQVRPRVEPGATVNPWFLGLVVRSCGARHRQWELPAPRHEASADALPLYEATRAAEWHDAEDEPARRLFARLQPGDITAALRSLPWEQRVVASLYYITQWSYEDLARALEITRQELRPRLHRARRALQVALCARARAAGVLPAA